ncbi:MAG TPA: hypothetical protein VGW34_02760, partial [Allosphingosinicella sp.]|nr:hypothetical protein [Allosphingosinicella sp.]
ISLELARLIVRARPGEITFRVAVGADGRVTGCSVARAAGAAAIGAHGCRLIGERNRYEPARDAAGNPVAGIAYETHAWGLSGRRRRPR